MGRQVGVLGNRFDDDRLDIRALQTHPRLGINAVEIGVAAGRFAGLVEREDVAATFGDGGQGVVGGDVVAGEPEVARNSIPCGELHACFARARARGGG